MQEQILIASIVSYIVLINLLASLMAAVDKKKAVHNKRRISENSLMTAAVLGGAIGEYFTMKKIHHKTLHKKFMIGLPLIIAGQIIIAVLILIKVTA